MSTNIKIVNNVNLVNCYCTYENEEMYSADKELKIVANSGYEFDVGVSYTFNFAIPGDRPSTFNFINNITELVLDHSDSSLEEKLLYDGSYVASIILNEDIIAIGGSVPVETNIYNNIYLVTREELNKLSNYLYIDSEGSLVDYERFILSLYSVRFSIPSDSIVEGVNIELGNKQTDIITNTIDRNYINIDMGSIEVNSKYNNVYDYINTEYILHLPYFDKIYLNSEYVVNQTISINGILDLYSGALTINVSSSFIDNIIESRTNLVSNNIPFMQKQTNSIMGSVSSNNRFNINKPFIEVVRNIPYNTNSIFGNEVIEYGVIGEYEGFIKCENVVLNSSATNSEKDEIKHLLGEGVII